MKMNTLPTVMAALALLAVLTGLAASQDSSLPKDKTPWTAGAALLRPGPAGAFDETAVKDPAVVFHQRRWHVFYTARGRGQCALGYVAAARLEDLQTAPRAHLEQLRGSRDGYAAAPQVFYFEPQRRWYLIYQVRDEKSGADYRPVYATAPVVDQPGAWDGPHPLAEKQDSAKWIDFWVICDETTACLFYTRGHRDVYAMTTPLSEFPRGFANPRVVFGPVHEAVHIYQAEGRAEYHMLCEMRTPEDIRHFSLFTAPHPLGPWSLVDERYAAGEQLISADSAARWTEEVSHGEMLRVGVDQRLEYDASRPRFLIQGLLKAEHQGAYPSLPWKLGLITRGNGD